jgi:hypothetical protein
MVRPNRKLKIFRVGVGWWFGGPSLKNKVWMIKTPKNKPNFTLFSICVEKNRIFLTTTEYFFKRIRNVFPSYVTSETNKKYWINIYGMPRRAETKVIENDKIMKLFTKSQI